MRIAMVGTGYVGLVSGACFSDFGHEVVCVDKDAAKIQRLTRGEVPIFEPGLEALIAKNAAAGRLSFSTDLETAVAGVEAVFIAVGTPTRRGDGHADLSYVMAAAADARGERRRFGLPRGGRRRRRAGRGRARVHRLSGAPRTSPS